jgi:hypothetical protein
MILELEPLELAGVLVAVFLVGGLVGLVLHHLERWWVNRRSRR